MAAVVDALLECGVPADEALDACDVSFDQLHSPRTKISRNQLIRCYRNAIALSRDPHLPFTIGSSVHLSAYGMYGYAMLCSTDFRRTMDFATRYHQLATPLASISFEERDGLGIWTIEPVLHPKIDAQLYRFVTEVQIATHISLQRDIMGQSFRPREIGLAYPPSTDFGITEALAGCPVRFEQAMNEIAFDSIFLDEAPRLGNRTTYPAIVALCDDLLQELALRTGAAGKVRKVLLRDFANRPTFEDIAKLLKTPSRTLRRQLRKQGASFRQLSDELRLYVALRYLRDTRMTNEDIAFALGFSDAANFRHAFRRWTGKAPNDFRWEATGSPYDELENARR
ncbi:MAG: AraC family transcriptional regulator [Roseiarcus sp.]|uniref:AraC family transcriptional regulator n=1 Tax=Roseiarcus sp. TaxID=1969460 RepID=UPI003C545507